MAHTSLDDPSREHPAATYWGGHERIGSTFRTWPGDDSPHSPEERAKRRRSILREVRRAIEGLQAAGAVKVADVSRVTAPGISQAYLLTLRRDGT
jgi:hypothetical protein